MLFTLALHNTNIPLKLSCLLSVLQLSQAQDGVSRELQRLDAAKESCLDQINNVFQQVQHMLDKRKQEMVEAVNVACTEKRKVLEEQHSLIESEKNKVIIAFMALSGCIVNVNCTH